MQRRFWRSVALRRGFVGVVVLGLAAGAVVPAAQAAPAVEGDDLPPWMKDAFEAGSEPVELAPWEDSPSAPLELPGTGTVEPPEVSFPEPSAWDVSLSEAIEVEEPTPERPVAVRVADGVGGGSAADVTVEVLDRVAAERAGASGFVFEVSGVGGASLAEVAEDLTEADDLPVETSDHLPGPTMGSPFASRTATPTSRSVQPDVRAGLRGRRSRTFPQGPPSGTQWPPAGAPDGRRQPSPSPGADSLPGRAL